MGDKDIEHLVIKYLSKSANASELDRLEEWIRKTENIGLLREYVKANYEIIYAMADQDEGRIRKRLLSEIRADKRKMRRKRIATTLKYAFVFLLLIAGGSTLFFFYGRGDSIGTEVPPPNSVTLQLDNGELKILDEKVTGSITDRQGKVLGSQDGRKLTYKKNGSVGKLVFNTMTVPYGKRFDLELSDGTEVHLNAGSVLRYPVRFMDGEKRQVFLTGEAYFKVSESGKNPFLVTSEEMDVQVTGTVFNISSYPEDDTRDVVLVSGRLELSASGAVAESNGAKTMPLAPGEKGTLMKNSKTLSATPVVTDIYTSWIDGKLVFRHMSFANIMKKLERHYNVTIVNRNQSLANERFNANFGDEPLDKVLGYFEKTYSIAYSIDGNRVVIEESSENP